MSDTNQDPIPSSGQPQTPPPAAPPLPPPYGAPPAPDPSPIPAPPPYGAPPAAAYPGQPYVQTQPYGAAPAYYPAYGEPKTNVLAVISMIASIVGFVWILPFVGSLAGVIMGHISLRQIAASGEKGRGMALAGLIVGYVGLAFFIVGIILFLLFVTLAASQGVPASR